MPTSVVTAAPALAIATLHAAMAVGRKADPGPGHVALRGDRSAHGQIAGQRQTPALRQGKGQHMGLRIVGQRGAIGEGDQRHLAVAGHREGVAGNPAQRDGRANLACRAQHQHLFALRGRRPHAGLPHAGCGPADWPGAQAFVDLDHAGAPRMIDRGHAAKADQLVGIGQGALRGSHAPHQPRPDRARHGAGLWPRAAQRARVVRRPGPG
jgi:hypothetical protein